jgi:hypothetical protein
MIVLLEWGICPYHDITITCSLCAMRPMAATSSLGRALHGLLVSVKYKDPPVSSVCVCVCLLWEKESGGLF